MEICPSINKSGAGASLESGVVVGSMGYDVATHTRTHTHGILFTASLHHISFKVITHTYITSAATGAV